MAETLVKLSPEDLLDTVQKLGKTTNYVKDLAIKAWDLKRKYIFKCKRRKFKCKFKANKRCQKCKVYGKFELNKNYVVNCQGRSNLLMSKQKITQPSFKVCLNAQKLIVRN